MPCTCSHCELIVKLEQPHFWGLPLCFYLSSCSAALGLLFVCHGQLPVRDASQSWTCMLKCKPTRRKVLLVRHWGVKELTRFHRDLAQVALGSNPRPVPLQL